MTSSKIIEVMADEIEDECLMYGAAVDPELAKRAATRAYTALQTSGQGMAVVPKDLLENFAALGGKNDGIMPAYYEMEDDEVVYQSAGRCITAGDVRAARAALGWLHAPYTRRTASPNIKSPDREGEQDE